MPTAVADYDARWSCRGLDARRYERRRYGGLVRRLNHRLLERALGRDLRVVATVCHPYTLKSFGRMLRRALGPAKRSPRLTRHALAREVAAAGLRLERVIRVLPLLSEAWVVVMRNPGSS